MNVECFVAGIVKGVKEHGDASRHFGSTLAMRSHWEDAIYSGLVCGTIKNAKLSERGLKAYDVWKLADMPDGRSYMWPRKVFDLSEIDG